MPSSSPIVKLLEQAADLVDELERRLRWHIVEVESITESYDEAKVMLEESEQEAAGFEELVYTADRREQGALSPRWYEEQLTALEARGGLHN